MVPPKLTTWGRRNLHTSGRTRGAGGAFPGPRPGYPGAQPPVGREGGGPSRPRKSGSEPGLPHPRPGPRRAPARLPGSRGNPALGPPRLQEAVPPRPAARDVAAAGAHPCRAPAPAPHPAPPPPPPRPARAALRPRPRRTPAPPPPRPRPRGAPGAGLQGPAVARLPGPPSYLRAGATPAARMGHGGGGRRGPRGAPGAPESRRRPVFRHFGGPGRHPPGRPAPHPGAAAALEARTSPDQGKPNRRAAGDAAPRGCSCAARASGRASLRVWVSEVRAAAAREALLRRRAWVLLSLSRSLSTARLPALSALPAHAPLLLGPGRAGGPPAHCQRAARAGPTPGRCARVFPAAQEPVPTRL